MEPPFLFIEGGGVHTRAKWDPHHFTPGGSHPPLTRGTFWPNLNSVKNVFFLFIWLILGILHIVLAKKTFNFNFFEKYGQFKLLIAKKDVKCKIKIGTLQN